MFKVIYQLDLTRYESDQSRLLCVMAKSQPSFQHLYQGGARSFWIHNTGPIGCLPVTLHYYHQPMPGILDEHGCVIAQNDVAKEFNWHLESRVIKLREQLPNAALTYVDVFAAKYKLISNAKKQGSTSIFVVTMILLLAKSDTS